MGRAKGRGSDHSAERQEKLLVTRAEAVVGKVHELENLKVRGGVLVIKKRAQKRNSSSGKDIERSV